MHLLTITILATMTIVVGCNSKLSGKGNAPATLDDTTVTPESINNPPDNTPPDGSSTTVVNSQSAAVVTHGNLSVKASKGSLPDGAKISISLTSDGGDEFKKNISLTSGNILQGPWIITTATPDNSTILPSENLELSLELQTDASKSTSTYVVLIDKSTGQVYFVPFKDIGSTTSAGTSLATMEIGGMGNFTISAIADVNLPLPASWQPWPWPTNPQHQDADTTAPIIPNSAPAVSSASTSSFVINWPPASDNESAPLLQYFVCSGPSISSINTVERCLNSTQEMGFTAGQTQLQITSKQPGTTYYFNIVVKDTAGNMAIYDGIAASTSVPDVNAPVVGSFAAPSAISATGFTLNWSASADTVSLSNELQYFVCSGPNTAALNTVEKCLAAQQELAYTANKTSLTIVNKSPATTYYFNIVVKDAAGNESLYDPSGLSVATSADTTGPVAGLFLSATGVTDSGFTLRWQAATDDSTAPSNIQYLVCSDTSLTTIGTVTGCENATEEMTFSANTTSLTISGKQPNTTYFYNVVAMDAYGHKTAYTPTQQTTSPDTQAPTIGAFASSTAVSATGFTLNWSAATDNVTSAANLQYFVCSGASAAAIASITNCLTATKELDFTAATTSLIVTGKSASTTYYFNVVVQDNAGNKAIYSAKSQATLAEPTAPTAGNFSATTSITDQTFTLNWTAASDEATAEEDLEYFVCTGVDAASIATVAGCEGATTVMNYTANKTTFSISGKSPASTYYFNVIVRNAGGKTSIYPGTSVTTDAAAPGPDQSFGADGYFASNKLRVTELPAGIFLGYAPTNNVAVQANGSIIAVGHSQETNPYPFSTVRYNSDGSADTTFNGTGTVTTLIGNDNMLATSVAVQTDGKIIVVGRAFFLNDFQIKITAIRYQPDGTLDSSFNGTGVWTSNMGGLNGTNSAYSVLVQTDGKIIITATAYDDYDENFDLILFRLTALGNLDTTFAGTGILNLATSLIHTAASALQPDGKIVVNSAGKIFRVDADGTLDTSFNGTGHVVSTSTGYFAQPSTMTPVFQSDGKIIIVGATWNTGTGNDFVIERFNTDGSPDSSFNGTGKVTLDLSGSEDFAAAAATDASGRILVVGSITSASDYAAIIRLNSDGSRDMSFNTSGIAVLTSSGAEYPYTISVNPDGKILVGGSKGGYQFFYRFVP